MTDKTLEYLIHNKNPEPLTVIVEFWAEEVTLSPGSSLLLTIFYDREGMLEVETNPNYYVVWLWGGCRGKACFEWQRTKNALASHTISVIEV
jgi:hypothetical protein